jgi:hypothetical protein
MTLLLHCVSKIDLWKFVYSTGCAGEKRRTETLKHVSAFSYAVGSSDRIALIITGDTVVSRWLNCLLFKLLFGLV